MLAAFSLMLIPSAHAQNPVQELATLEIEIWPDYDQPSVLVLLTGTLADDAAVPATVVLPMPEEASINAVAHVNADSGQLENVTDVDSNTPGQLTFTTPSPTFRIEYYTPYESDGDQRDITFDWQSDMTIDQVITTVQQPAEATEFEVAPAAAQATPGRDGLVYHALSPQPLPAGQSYTVSVSYDLASNQLSADLLTAQQPSVQGPLPVVSDSAAAAEPGFNWALVAIVAGGLIIVAAVVWFLYSSSGRSRKRTPRPRPIRTTKPGNAKAAAPSSSAAQFCHNCGQAVDPEDRFCRECGTPLKGR